MYPICINEAGEVLPRRVLAGSIDTLTYFRRCSYSGTDSDPALGWIAGSSTVGSAILPFMTGALASCFGISALQRLYVRLPRIVLIDLALQNCNDDGFYGLRLSPHA